MEFCVPLYKRIAEKKDFRLNIKLKCFTLSLQSFLQLFPAALKSYLSVSGAHFLAGSLG